MTLGWSPVHTHPHGHQRVVRGERWGLGRFVRRPGHPDWCEDNAIGPAALAVLPRRAVEIAQSGHRAVVANPGTAIFYDPQTAYRRRLIDPKGDDCVHFTIGAAAWRDLVDHLDPSARDDRLFRFARGPIRPSVALEAQALVDALESDPTAVDDLQVEERLLALGALLVTDAVAAAGGSVREDPTTRRHRDAAHALEELVSARFRESLSLEALADAVGLSRFHAARVFRRSTGASLHQYRDRLRLHAALPRLRHADRLDALAMDLGYASHSHFTDRFTRWFGVPPSAVR